MSEQRILSELKFIVVLFQPKSISHEFTSYQANNKKVTTTAATANDEIQRSDSTLSKLPGL